MLYLVHVLFVELNPLPESEGQELVVIELVRVRDVGRVEERPQRARLEFGERVKQFTPIAQRDASRQGGRDGIDVGTGRDERRGELLEGDGSRVVRVDELKELAQTRDLSRGAMRGNEGNERQMGGRERLGEPLRLPREG